MPNINSSQILTRREFAAKAARVAGAASITSFVPSWIFSDSASAGRVTIRTDQEIGIVRPELHGQFAEHLGACVYGGMWVGKNSPIPNTNGFRKQAIEYLRELGIPVLRWPGGCFADDYHWRDGIGVPAQRPKRVNIHWGGYVEDNSFGTHEFIELCRLLGAEPYLAGNVGSGSPEELRDWIEYCNFPGGSSLSEARAKNGSPDPFHVKY
jgi:alpha-N-arabinofuranosidase